MMVGPPDPVYLLQIQCTCSVQGMYLVVSTPRQVGIIVCVLHLGNLILAGGT